MTDAANPSSLAAEERLSEVADILATDLLRLRFRTRVAEGNFLGNNLEVPRRDRPHVAHLNRKETT